MALPTQITDSSRKGGISFGIPGYRDASIPRGAPRSKKCKARRLKMRDKGEEKKGGEGQGRAMLGIE